MRKLFNQFLQAWNFRTYDEKEQSFIRMNRLRSFIHP